LVKGAGLDHGPVDPEQFLLREAGIELRIGPAVGIEDLEIGYAELRDHLAWHS